MSAEDGSECRRYVINPGEYGKMRKEFYDEIYTSRLLILVLYWTYYQFNFTNF